MTPPDIASFLLAHSLQPDFPQKFQQISSQFTQEVLRELVQRVSKEQLRNPQRALQFAQIAEQVADVIGTAVAQGLATWVRGNVLYYLNRYQEALTQFQKAETFYQRQGNDLTVAALQVNQVAVLRDLGDYPKALAQETKARAACQRIGEPAEGYLANLEMTVGWIYEEMGQPETALATYDRGRDIFVRQGNTTSIALMDVNRAYVLEKIDRFAEAETLLQSAVSTFTAEGYDQEIARAEMNLGALASRTGQYQLALQRLNKAYDHFAAIAVPAEMAVVNLERAFVYGRLHLFHEMVTLAIEAEKTVRHHRMRREHSLSLIQQGTAYQQLGLYDMAENALARARRQLQKQKAEGKVWAVDMQRAELYWVMNQPNRASRIAQRILAVVNPTQAPSLVGQAHLLLARCAANKGKWRVANDRLKMVYTLAQTYHLTELGIEAAHLTSLILEKNGRIAEALQQCQEAIQEIHRLQTYFSLDELSLGFGESKQVIYQTAVRLAYQLTQTGQGSVANLLTILNQAHTAPLVQSPAAPATTASSRLSNLRHTWQWYQSKTDPFRKTNPLDTPPDIAHWQEQLKQLEAEIADLMRQEQVRTVSSRFVAFAEEGPQTDLLQKLQSRLSSDEGLLHYFVVNGQFQALILTTTSHALIPDLLAIPALERLMKAWRFYLQHTQTTWQTADPQHQRAQMYLMPLYRSLWLPLLPHLVACRRLYVVLPPDWHDLPLAALFDGQQYVAESYQLSYLSSPASLLLKIGHIAPLPLDFKAVVVGYSDNGRLPHAPLEAQHIAQLLASGDVTCLVDEAATRAAFQAASPQAHLIHLATHVLFRPDNPLFSWMRLADDHFTVGDFYRLHLLKRPLVVLSGCETGKGLARGGGLFGMGRAFLAAGAAGLVVTLWPVADQTTAEWMTAFYQFLQHHPPALALCKAQREAIQNGRSPFSWAAFNYLSG